MAPLEPAARSWLPHYSAQLLSSALGSLPLDAFLKGVAVGSGEHDRFVDLQTLVAECLGAAQRATGNPEERHVSGARVHDGLLNTQVVEDAIDRSLVPTQPEDDAAVSDRPERREL